MHKYKNASRHVRGLVAAFFLMALAIALTCCQQIIQPNVDQRAFELAYQCSPAAIADRGVIALSERVPGELIRGSLDPKYGLNDFEAAAVIQAPMNDPRSEYILGWICENGGERSLSNVDLANLALEQIDLGALPLSSNQVLAAQWYALASMHGSTEGSLQLARLLKKNCENGERYSHFLANKYLNKAAFDGNKTARIQLSYCYACGDGCKPNGARAWDELQKIIYGQDAAQSERAIIATIQLWKNGKIQPTRNFSHGESSAYNFVRRFDHNMTDEALDSLYRVHGYMPDPNPQWKLELAIKIRNEFWVEH